MLCLVLLYVAIPSHFPYKVKSDAPKISKKSLKRVDVLGAVLMLAATTLCLTALEQSSTSSPWSSPGVLGPLISGLAIYIAFLAWSRMQDSRETPQEPLVPWHILTDRFCLALFAQSFWMATIMFSLLLALPQRFQVVDQSSALAAGYRLLPFTLVDPFGAAISAWLLTSKRVPAFWLLLIGNCIQTLGVGLLLLPPRSRDDSPMVWETSKYIIEGFTGFGIGWTSAATILAVVLYFKPRDVSVGMGGLAQFRSLGGAIGIAATTNVLNRYMDGDLNGTLSKEQLEAVKGSAEAVNGFEVEMQKLVREAYARGFGWQTVSMTVFGGVGLCMLALLAEKKFRRLEQTTKPDAVEEQEA